jgi:hypothetical protein
MKLRIFNFLSTAFVTLVLLTDNTSAFIPNVKFQSGTKDAHALKADSDLTEITSIAQTHSVKTIQSFSIAIIPPKTQFNQQEILKKPKQSMSLLAKVFITSVLIGFILGWLLQYSKYKKDSANRKDKLFKELETLEKIRILEIENQENLKKMTYSELDPTILQQREKQIEILERIWKMKP